LSAYSLAKRLGSLLEITLVESEQIATVGVGEATVPTMRTFHKIVEIDEREFMSSTQGSFKLAIKFDNWAKIGDQYIHSFGRIGERSWMTEFHAYWFELNAHGLGGNLDDYCLEWKAAKQDKFALKAGKTELNYAYHLNATEYARYLRGKSEGLGVTRTEGKISKVNLCPETGNILSLELERGEIVEGDLFIDCTGFRSLLLGQTLGVPYDDWSHWIASDSAWAMQSESAETPPYTRAIAFKCGWQWRIPLQHRTGIGFVYSSRFCSDDEARSILMNNLTGPPITEPYLLKFKTGRRVTPWHKNCVAIGLASGFIEPLESTSIHLITTALVRLMRLFPFTRNFEQQAARYNDESKIEMEEVRNFIILHYHQTLRDDTAFWNYYRTMEIPEALAHRLKIFRENGYVWPDNANLFRVDSWVQVMLGQRLIPESNHGARRILSAQTLADQVKPLRDEVDRNLALLPRHEDFLKTYCPMAR
jgi:tryptophan halogenase